MEQMELRERFGYTDINEDVISHGVICFLFIHRLIERVVEKEGLSFGEFMVLLHLRGAKNEKNLGQVKHGLLIFCGASVTKVVEKLVKKRLISRRINPESRREKLIKATPDGRRMINKLVRKLRSLNDAVLEGFSLPQKQQMRAICNAVLSNAIKVSENR